MLPYHHYSLLQPTRCCITVAMFVALGKKSFLPCASYVHTYSLALFYVMLFLLNLTICQVQKQVWKRERHLIISVYFVFFIFTLQCHDPVTDHSLTFPESRPSPTLLHKNWTCWICNCPFKEQNNRRFIVHFYNPNSIPLSLFLHLNIVVKGQISVVHRVVKLYN